MNSTKAFLPNQAALFILTVAALFMTGFSANAQSVQHLSVTHPGGIPGMPTVTGIQPGSNNVTVTWDGPSGYYQLFQRVGSDAKWQAVGPGTNMARRATISTVYSNAFFTVLGPAPQYVGSQTCTECHTKIHDTEMNTRHAQALQALKQAGQGNNASCLPCHTVGFGLPTGFVSETATTQLGGVQCENCHGPAGNHAANPDDRSVRPRLEQAATVCGGCHSGSHNPTFDEWKNTGHAFVVEDMNATNRIDSCGRCHSGSARLSMLNRKPLPSGDANMGIGCVVCHDPHQTNSNPAQLRNPVASTEDYFVSTSGTLTNQYNPNINICAQCHNHRGASWTSSSRPPHHSPQYNMLLGTVGELPSGERPNQPASHAFISKQCVSCHMQKKGFVSETEPAVTGHSFQVQSFEVCQDCHSSPEGLVGFTSSAISYQIEQVKAALNLWATTKAPAALQTKYGALGWEYTTPGSLSSGGPGPSSGDQASIPDNIKKARFNLYLVLYDGSYGVHNGPYAVTLLNAAQDWVQAELNK